MFNGPDIDVQTAVPRSALRAVGRRLRRAALRLGLTPREVAGIAVHIVDDATIARLNRQHMGKRGPTDVLSFPTGERDLGEWHGPTSEAPPLLLGDIVLSWPAVIRQAARKDPAGLVDEASALVIHGLAHLLGHDHRTRGEGRRMHGVELRALAAARVPDIDRPYGLRR